jgi:hypothetical protein
MASFDALATIQPAIRCRFSLRHTQSDQRCLKMTGCADFP